MPTRREIWRHNSFFGHAAMTRTHMMLIRNSETPTAESKEIAEQIELLCNRLIESLKTRTDHLEEKPNDQRS